MKRTQAVDTDQCAVCNIVDMQSYVDKKTFNLHIMFIAKNVTLVLTSIKFETILISLTNIFFITLT